MISLQDFSYEELLTLIQERGFPAFRREQLYDMVMRNKSYDEATNLPKKLIENLAKDYPPMSVEIADEYRGKDGAIKYLYRLTDGNIIEGVYMPHNYGDTLCVSTQVGCRMGCKFCASGIGGLVRNLTAGEMVGQVLLANRLNGGLPNKRAVTNIVLMGSGEPLDNYDNVIKFLQLISAEKGINISPRNISLSTVGIPDKIRELALSGYPITLSISLHAPTNAKRERLIPLNKLHNIDDIFQAAKYYFDQTGRRIIFEYALVEGENSTKESAEELIQLVKGLPAHINLIPLNYVKEKALRSANHHLINDFLDTLTKNNISATVRRSMGSDIGGACGQLRNTFVKNSVTQS